MRRVTLLRHGEGATTGIGVRFTKAVNGPCKIVSIAPGGPASRSQINLNDYIHELNGRKVHSMGVQDVVNEILGRSGTTIVLTVSDREHPFPSPQQPRQAPMHRTPQHHQQQQQRTPQQQPRTPRQPPPPPPSKPLQHQQPIASTQRHPQHNEGHMRQQQYTQHQQNHPLMGRRPAPMSPEDALKDGVNGTTRSAAVDRTASSHAMQANSSTRRHTDAQQMPPSIPFNVNSSLQYHSQTANANAETSPGGQEKMKNQIVAKQNVLPRASISVQRSAPPPSEWSTPGGKRGDLVTYSAMDRSPQSGTRAANEKVVAKGASPTSVRITALKDTAERIRSTLKKHSEEHAEAKHVLSTAVIISPQRSAQNASAPHLEKDSPSKADRATTEVLLADSIVKKKQYSIPYTSPEKGPEGAPLGSRDHVSSTYRPKHHQGDVTSRTGAGNPDSAARSNDTSALNGGREQAYAQGDADPQYVTPKKPSACGGSLSIDSIVKQSGSGGKTDSPGGGRPVAPIGGKGSAFQIVTPRKSPIRSKTNSVNGSTTLSTESAKNASDFPAQSDGSVCEVEPFKYNVSVKAQSNNWDSDVYEVRVWLGSTLLSKDALVKTHHDCLDLQAKLSERYLSSLSHNHASCNSVRSAEQSSARIDATKTFLSSLLQHESFLKDVSVRDFFHPVPIVSHELDEQNAMRRDLENMKMERDILREQLSNANNRLELQQRNIQKQMIVQEDLEISTEREKDELRKIIRDLQLEVETLKKFNEAEKGKRGGVPPASHPGTDGKAAHNQNSSPHTQEISNSISVPVLSKAYEGWMARELRSREDAQRVREDELVSALGHATNEANYWKEEATRQRELCAQAWKEPPGEVAVQLTSNGAGAHVLQTRRNLRLDNASDAAQSAGHDKHTSDSNRTSVTVRNPPAGSVLWRPPSGVVVNGKGNTAPPGSAADPEDTHPAIEISALPDAHRRKSDIWREESRAAQARDRKPLRCNGIDVPSLTISSIQGGSKNALSSGANVEKGDGGGYSTARRHSPIETSETQVMVMDLQVGDDSLTTRTNGPSPYQEEGTQSVPGLQIATPRLSPSAAEAERLPRHKYEQMAREYRIIGR